MKTKLLHLFITNGKKTVVDEVLNLSTIRYYYCPATYMACNKEHFHENLIAQQQNHRCCNCIVRNLTELFTEYNSFMPVQLATFPIKKRKTEKEDNNENQKNSFNSFSGSILTVLIRYGNLQKFFYVCAKLWNLLIFVFSLELVRKFTTVTAIASNIMSMHLVQVYNLSYQVLWL